MCMSVLTVYISVHDFCLPKPEDDTGSQNCRYRCFQAILGVLRVDPRSSRSTLNHFLSPS